MKKTVFALALLGAFISRPALAANYLYMTGASNPWGQSSEDKAMDLAFGAGNWDKANGFNSSAFSSGYSFLYFDGGAGDSDEFNRFVSTNFRSITSFVNSGGHIMLNAARWSDNLLGTTFGTSLTPQRYSYVANLTWMGLFAGLDRKGAGTAWIGTYFSHDLVRGLDTCYVTTSAGCVFGSMDNLFVGGQTAPIFHSDGGLQLRANELALASGGVADLRASLPGFSDFHALASAPEPNTWALMIAGIGLVGFGMRRRKTQVRFAF